MLSPGVPHLASESASEQLPESSRQRLVLLVEDEESLGELLVHLLSRTSIPAVRAADGTTALRLFAEHRSDVALAFVDCRLPDMDGGDLCRELRTLAPGLPLLVTSGRDQRLLIRSLVDGGRTGFLQKPYMPADVIRHVNALLSAST